MYSKVAKQVNIESKAEGALGAVDCTSEKELCAKQEVKGYPSCECFHFRSTLVTRLKYIVTVEWWNRK